MTDFQQQLPEITGTQHNSLPQLPSISSLLPRGFEECYFNPPHQNAMPGYSYQQQPHWSWQTTYHYQTSPATHLYTAQPHSLVPPTSQSPVSEYSQAVNHHERFSATDNLSAAASPKKIQKPAKMRYKAGKKSRSPRLTPTSPPKPAEVKQEESHVLDRSNSPNLITPVAGGKKRDRKVPTAYNLYYKEEFSVIRKEHPHTPIAELSSMIAERWRTLSKKEQLKFYDKYKVSKQAEGKKKRPLNAYHLFCKEKFEQIKKDKPDGDVATWSRIAGAMWKNLTIEGQRVYYEKASRI